jgi:hypothetical protein
MPSAFVAVGVFQERRGTVLSRYVRSCLRDVCFVCRCHVSFGCRFSAACALVKEARWLDRLPHTARGVNSRGLTVANYAANLSSKCSVWCHPCGIVIFSFSCRRRVGLSSQPSSLAFPPAALIRAEAPDLTSEDHAANIRNVNGSNLWAWNDRSGVAEPRPCLISRTTHHTPAWSTTSLQLLRALGQGATADSGWVNQLAPATTILHVPAHGYLQVLSSSQYLLRVVNMTVASYDDRLEFLRPARVSA